GPAARAGGADPGGTGAASLDLPAWPAQSAVGHRHPQRPCQGLAQGRRRKRPGTTGPRGTCCNKRRASAINSRRTAGGPGAPATSPQIVGLIEKSLDDDKAEDIVVIDLHGKSSFADFMVIASGRSQRQVGAMAEHLVAKLKAGGVPKVGLEGTRGCDWVLI